MCLGEQGCRWAEVGPHIATKLQVQRGFARANVRMKISFVFRILRSLTREGISHPHDKERCMTHATADDNTLEIVAMDGPHWDLPKAKPEERITDGFVLVLFFGFFAGSVVVF